MSFLPFEQGADVPKEQAQNSRTITAGKNPLGARKDGEYVIVCMAPSVTLTPIGDKVVPVPYNISQTLDISEYVSTNVHFNGNEAFIWNSMTPTVEGDGRGTKKGIKSGTQGLICEPLDDAGSKTVHVNGKRLIRVGDKFKMNKVSKGNG